MPGGNLLPQSTDLPIDDDQHQVQREGSVKEVLPRKWLTGKSTMAKITDLPNGKNQ